MLIDVAALLPLTENPVRLVLGGICLGFTFSGLLAAALLKRLLRNTRAGDAAEVRPVRADLAHLEQAGFPICSEIVSAKARAYSK